MYVPVFVDEGTTRGRRGKTVPLVIVWITLYSFQQLLQLAATKSAFLFILNSFLVATALGFKGQLSFHVLVKN